jgi:hypothetical protein
MSDVSYESSYPTLFFRIVYVIAAQKRMPSQRYAFRDQFLTTLINPHQMLYSVRFALADLFDAIDACADKYEASKMPIKYIPAVLLMRIVASHCEVKSEASGAVLSTKCTFLELTPHKYTHYFT